MKAKRQLSQDLSTARPELVLSGGPLRLADWLKVSWFFPQGFKAQEFIETPSGYIILGDTLVYKFFKQSSPHPELAGEPFSLRWRLACEELQDNLELAPDLYLGLRLLRWLDGEPHWSTEAGIKGLSANAPPEDADDVALVMRRYAKESVLQARLTAGEAIPRVELKRLAMKLNRFHLRRKKAGIGYFLAHPKECERCLYADTVLRAKRLVELYGSFVDPFTKTALYESKAHLEGFFEEAVSKFKVRGKSGFVISAHGALWSKNILAALPDADSKYPLFLGRARRSDPVRYSDILSDIASLSAELSALGYPALASVFEDYYFSLNPEAYDKNLLCFYKTARLLSLVEESLRQGLDRCWERASRIISSAAANALGMAGPFIIGLGGSDEDARISLAQGIAELLGATEVSLDGESAQLAPLLLNPACCFDRLLLRTRNLVRQGRGVVFSWPMHHEEERLEAAKLAHGLGVPFLLVKCAKSRAEAVSLRTVPIYTDHRSESEMALNKITDCKPWATGVSCSSVHQIYLETVMSQSELILYVLREFSRINRDLNG